MCKPVALDARAYCDGGVIRPWRVDVKSTGKSGGSCSMRGLRKFLRVQADIGAELAFYLLSKADITLYFSNNAIRLGFVGLLPCAHDVVALTIICWNWTTCEYNFLRPVKRRRRIFNAQPLEKAQREFRIIATGIRQILADATVTNFQNEARPSTTAASPSVSLLGCSVMLRDGSIL